jgi:hypothetical protein
MKPAGSPAGFILNDMTPDRGCGCVSKAKTPLPGRVLRQSASFD